MGHYPTGGKGLGLLGGPLVPRVLVALILGQGLPLLLGLFGLFLGEKGLDLIEALFERGQPLVEVRHGTEVETVHLYKLTELPNPRVQRVVRRAAGTVA